MAFPTKTASQDTEDQFKPLMGLSRHWLQLVGPTWTSDHSMGPQAWEDSIVICFRQHSNLIYFRFKQEPRTSLDTINYPFPPLLLKKEGALGVLAESPSFGGSGFTPG